MDDHPRQASGGPTLPDASYLEAIDLDAARLAGAAGTDLDAVVPACPDWTVRDLIDHVSTIHRWALAQCLAAPDRVRRRDVPGRADGDDPIEWLEQSVTLTTAHLRDADLAVPTQTWAGEQDRRWWLRRLANETAVHRWDAQIATGRPDPIEAPLASDGIDEVLEWFAPLILDRTTLDRAHSLHLHATDPVARDGDDHVGEWFVEVGPDVYRWDHRHAKGEVAARGPASALLLALWGRSDDQVEIIGDASLFQRVARSMTA